MQDNFYVSKYNVTYSQYESKKFFLILRQVHSGVSFAIGFRKLILKINVFFTVMIVEYSRLYCNHDSNSLQLFTKPILSEVI